MISKKKKLILDIYTENIYIMNPSNFFIKKPILNSQCARFKREFSIPLTSKSFINGEKSSKFLSQIRPFLTLPRANVPFYNVNKYSLFRIPLV